MRIKWNMNDIAEIGKARIEDKKDFIICITGARGDGKSTFGYKLAHKLKVKFNPRKDMIYSIKGILDWYSKNKNKAVLFDEAIAVHNREFYQKMQIKLIKILNMYRDSFNVLILCVPNFSNLDIQLRQLIRLRIHIDQRGMGIIMRPKLNAFGTDIWETSYNMKIEQRYLVRKKRVNYRKFTTFAGFIYFGDLPDRQRRLYEEVKDDKRNVIYEEDVGSEQKSTVEVLYDTLNTIEDKKERLAIRKKLARSMGIRDDVLAKRIKVVQEMKQITTPQTT